MARGPGRQNPRSLSSLPVHCSHRPARRSPAACPNRRARDLAARRECVLHADTPGSFGLTASWGGAHHWGERDRLLASKRRGPFADKKSKYERPEGERQMAAHAVADMIVDLDVPITMDDGLVLRADVFRPRTKGSVPVLMTLGPYGKGIPY